MYVNVSDASGVWIGWLAVCMKSEKLGDAVLRLPNSDGRFLFPEKNCPGRTGHRNFEHVTESISKSFMPVIREKRNQLGVFGLGSVCVVR